MKILFVDTYYPSFLRSLYSRHSKLGKESYNKQLNFILSKFFGTSDFFSYYFRKMNWKAVDLIINNEVLQRRWAKENGLKNVENKFLSKLRSVPYFSNLFGKPRWVAQIALEQIDRYKPDVVYFQDLGILSSNLLKEVKKKCKFLVGQIAYHLPPEENIKCFDLLVSSFPHFVKRFRGLGINSEYQKLAFDPRALQRVGKQKKIYNVTFVGSFTSAQHQKGTAILETVAKKIPIHVWGRGVEMLSQSSPLLKNYHGEAWGIDMYKIMAQSKITINRHGKVAENYANNMRLYEATGMGTLLITDSKKNLGELFKVGKEVVEYKNAKDLEEKINYYLKNEDKREKIAQSGQKRTFCEYSYSKSMSDLKFLLDKYVQH